MPTLDSHALAEAEYDALSRTLFVRFVSGQWYAYLDVPQATYDRLRTAESKGRFFQDAMRERYAYRRLGPLSP